VSLRGRAGAEGFLHWSNNFDEVQDFEGQIRALAGGTGLMSDSDFGAGTRSQPLGDTKAGFIQDLDALAAYVASLNNFDKTPFRNGSGNLTASAKSGKTVFGTLVCASCHGGPGYTNSGAGNPANIGTIKPTSGMRLGQPLTGIDIPTLRDVWNTAPYLHDGSAATLADAVTAHNNVSVGATDLANLVAYLEQIGQEEPDAPVILQQGLKGSYYNNTTMQGTPALIRLERVQGNWDGSPGTGVNADQFSVRWTGYIQGTTTGSYTFQAKSNDGMRLWINGVQLVDRWDSSGTVTNTSAPITLTAGIRYPITVEYFDLTGKAIAVLSWLRPGTSTYSVVAIDRLSTP
jgi:hypothetical protein